VAETPKTRLSKLRKHLAIPREFYIAAVQRQEERAWAYMTDPRRSVKLKRAFHDLRNKLLAEDGKAPEPMPEEPEVKQAPHPAVFDENEDISRDDALIAAYLADHPNETRRPNARGSTHEELLKYWHTCPEGRRHHEAVSRYLRPRMLELRDRLLVGE
jgi:hypothetical protein